MNRNEYLAYHKSMCERMIETTKKKNADYTGDSDDPFFNFRLVEMYGALSAEQGFFTRLSDKFSRVASFVKRGVLLVKDETIEDTLIDMANYCILFAGYIKSKKLKQLPQETDTQINSLFKEEG